MAEASAQPQAYRFGAYELRPQSRELLHDNDVVSLEPRVFDLLNYLLRHRDRAINKDELLEAVWGSVHVSETSLTRGIMKARRALGDGAERQHSIRTVHSHGYQFVAEVVETKRQTPEAGTEPGTGYINTQIKDTGDSAKTTIEVNSNRTLPSRHIGRWLLLATVFIISLAVLWMTPFRSSTEADEIPRIAVLPMSNATDDASMDWIELGLMDMLADELRLQSGFSVAPSRDVVRLWDRQSERTEDSDERVAETSARIFSQLGATRVLSATLERPGDHYRLRAQLLSPSGTGEPIELFGAQPAALISELRRTVDAQISGARRSERVASLVSDDLFVNEAYARGRDKMLRGELDEAQTLLQAGIDQEPENFWPRHALATALLQRGDAQGATAMLNTLLDEALEAGLRLEEASARFSLGTTHLRLRDYDSAVPLYEDALRLFRDLGMNYEAHKVLNNLAIIAGERQQYTEERMLLEQAMHAAEAAGIESTPGHILGGLANNAMSLGQLDEAKQHFLESLAAFRLEGLRTQEAVSYHSLSLVEQRLGNFATARSYAEQSVALSRETGQRFGESASLRRLAAVTFAQGDLAVAEDLYLQAQALGRELGEYVSVAVSLYYLSEINRLQGRIEDAERQLEEARAIVVETDELMGLISIQLYDGWIALEAGDFTGALAAADQAMGHDANLLPWLPVQAALLRGKAHRMAGDLDQSAAELEAGFELARQGSDQVLQSELAVELGLLSMQQANPEQAHAYLGIARDAAPNYYKVSLLAAVVAAHAGDLDQARNHFDEAHELAGGLWNAQDEALRRDTLSATAES